MPKPITIGVVDSGFSADQEHLVDQAAAFVVESGMLLQQSVTFDRVQHGTAVIGAMMKTAPMVRLVMAQVFTERFTTTPSQVAAAIQWLVGQQVDLINLSLGLRADRPVLQAAVASAQAAGITLCAATPARGDAVFPAAYPGVLRMTGDARCAETEWSCLLTRYADFGAFVRCPDNRSAGASIATGYLSGHIATYLADGGVSGLESIHDHLRRNARYFGAERRTG